jgi:catechol 2,3-dioxygenase-like lactoylglutathione lyase family enzyme
MPGAAPNAINLAFGTGETPRNSSTSLAWETEVLETMGLRHVALRVADVERARNFYTEVFGMRVVWQPDADNAYLSSGSDNLALHREAGTRGAAVLDHIGFFVADLAQLERNFAWAREHGLQIVHPLRQHRDGTHSFYIKDPDGVVIQLIYDPSVRTS